MNKQELLTNFVRATNGRGRAVGEKGQCVYFPKDHPGCSIGCQPGFRERFQGRLREGPSICGWLGRYLGAELSEFFQIEDLGFTQGADGTFLRHLQCFHDKHDHWIVTGLDCGKLKPDCLAVFCQKHGLEVPVIEDSR